LGDGFRIGLAAEGPVFDGGGKDRRRQPACRGPHGLRGGKSDKDGESNGNDQRNHRLSSQNAVRHGIARRIDGMVVSHSAGT